jgi:hypothetical protein
MRGCFSKITWMIAVGCGASLLGTAAHAAMLFTTSSDFTGWAADTATNTAGPSTTFDYDANTTNGAGNNPGNSGSTLGAGQTSAGGSLQTSWSSAVGNYGTLTYSPSEHFNPSFMAAIDPRANWRGTELVFLDFSPLPAMATGWRPAAK